MGIFKSIKDLFKPALAFTDKLIYSAEEKAQKKLTGEQIKVQAQKIKGEIEKAGNLADVEYAKMIVQLTQLQADLFKAEAQSTNPLTSSCRPVIVYVMLFVFLCSVFGVVQLNPETNRLVMYIIGASSGLFLLGRGTQQTIKEFRKK